jgi:hypothetical protein
VKPPNPGSPEAISLGCKCPRMDNCFGKGRGGCGETFGWFIAEACSVHAPITFKEKAP